MEALKNLSMHPQPYIRRFLIFFRNTLKNEPKARRLARNTLLNFIGQAYILAFRR